VTPILFHDVEVEGRRGDVHVSDGRVGAVAPRLDPLPGTEVIDGAGGALLPGLWDHHIHVVALAAARRSLPVGPPEVVDLEQLADALRRTASARPGRWIRAVGYHESVAGDLDRHRLDQLVRSAPVRVQHRSGALWMLNSAALDRLDLGHPPPGLERDEDGQFTGRLLGGDRWLRDRLGAADAPPDLAAVGRELAGYGVVGVTDATPYERLEDLQLLADAASSGALPQRLVAMGGPALSDRPFPPPLARGPVKLLLADHSLPPLADLTGWIRAARAAGRPVAAHCVTRASLALVLAALDDTGAAPGDRIEHGAVIPPELREPLARHHLTVVTQPNFVAERGDRYRRDVDAGDRPHLYPCRSLADAGIPVAGSTDAPFGRPDPWRSVAAAITRRTAGGRSLGAGERLRPADALALFLGPPQSPGAGARALRVGLGADLCLLRVPIAAIDEHVDATIVRATMIGGRVVHRSDS
jgi:predicted amidohydrolase YtcJ